MKSKWIVNAKFDNIDYDHEVKKDGKWVPVERKGYVFGVEISVVRESNKHGIESYGWAEEDKIILISEEELKVKDKDKIIE
jgi:hypothetical protein